MATIGSCEAKTHLPALLERVQKGEQITITRHGTPIAMLVPATPVPVKPRPQAIAELKSFRKGRSLPHWHARSRPHRKGPPLLKRAIVLDASVTLAWCFPDEQSSYADEVLHALMDRQAFVPSLCALEVAKRPACG